MAALKLTLHLGVVELPYTYGKAHRTTGDVATILEKKYGVIGMFVADNKAGIVGALTDQMHKSIRSVISGKPPGGDPMQGGLDKIQRDFRKYILARKLDGRVKGVPTLASLRGVNHKLKHPYARKNPARQSFYDTGLYIGSFKAWID